MARCKAFVPSESLPHGSTCRLYFVSEGRRNQSCKELTENHTSIHVYKSSEQAQYNDIWVDLSEDSHRVENGRDAKTHNGEHHV